MTRFLVLLAALSLLLTGCAGNAGAPSSPSTLPTSLALPTSLPTASADPAPTDDPTASGGGGETTDAHLTVVDSTDDEQVRPEWPLDSLGVVIDEEGTRCLSLTGDELALLEDESTFALGAGYVDASLVSPSGPGCTEGLTTVDLGLGGVVLTAEEFGADQGGTPTVDDVLAAEAAVAAALPTSDDERAPQVAERYPDDYARQYAGVVVDGRELLAINAFCYVSDASWLTSFQAFMDGGDCFWQAEVDVATGEVVTFSVNGEA